LLRVIVGRPPIIIGCLREIGTKLAVYNRVTLAPYSLFSDINESIVPVTTQCNNFDVINLQCKVSGVRDRTKE
jgi:hypothetical protein